MRGLLTGFGGLQSTYKNMEETRKKIETIVQMMGFSDVAVSLEPSLKKISVIVRNEPILKEHLGELVANLNAITRLIAKRYGEAQIIFDVNNYRRERESIILDLAKAAARKAVSTKETISLPPMNAYERRLVHAELGIRPDVKTESVGEGRDRYVVVKVVEG